MRSVGRAVVDRCGPVVVYFWLDEFMRLKTKYLGELYRDHRWLTGLWPSQADRERLLKIAHTKALLAVPWLDPTQLPQYTRIERV